MYNTKTQSHRRLGVGMLIFAWLILLGLLTLYFGGLLDRQHNPNQDVAGRVLADGVREVVLHENRRGHYVATGRINRQPVSFLLDTGATTVSVPAGLARRLGLPSGAPTPVQTANGVVTAYATRLERVELGEIALTDVRAHINPGMGGEDVLLGMSFLRQLDLTQRDGTLTLRQRTSRSASGI